MKLCGDCKQSRRSLCAAVKAHHGDCLKVLVNEGAGVDEISKAFLIALLHERFEDAELLFDSGIDANYCPKTPYRTPLISAVAKGHYCFAQKLIAAGASVNAVDFNGKAALHHSYNIDCLNLLINKGAVVNLKDKSGHTPLHAAVESVRGTLACCLLLMSAGADVNKAGNDGKTSLMKAIELDKVPQVRCLIENGANINVFDSRGRSALFYAAEQGNIAVLKLLLEAGADVNRVTSNRKQYSLIVAASNGYCEYVEILLQAGADVNAKDGDNRTALIGAACHGHEKCTILLLEAGASVNVVDNDSHTALISTARYGLDECVKLILEAGADVNSITHDTRYENQTALTLAASYGHEKCVKLLLNAGAYVNFCPYSDTLCKSMSRGRQTYTTVSMRKGADVNVLLPKNGESALVAAVFNNRIECVKLLLKAGAEIGIETANGFNVLPFYAMENRWKVNPEMISLVHAAGETKELPSYQLRFPGDKEKFGEIMQKYLQDDELTFCLKNICRYTIREHLLQMSRVNLFVRVPHLGLPPSLARYLLYDVSLDSQSG